MMPERFIQITQRHRRLLFVDLPLPRRQDFAVTALLHDAPVGHVIRDHARPVLPEIERTRVDRRHEFDEGLRGGQVILLPHGVGLDPKKIRHDRPKPAQ